MFSFRRKKVEPCEFLVNFTRKVVSKEEAEKRDSLYKSLSGLPIRELLKEVPPPSVRIPEEAGWRRRWCEVIDLREMPTKAKHLNIELEPSERKITVSGKFYTRKTRRDEVVTHAIHKWSKIIAVPDDVYLKTMSSKLEHSPDKLIFTADRAVPRYTPCERIPIKVLSPKEKWAQTK